MGAWRHPRGGWTIRALYGAAMLVVVGVLVVACGQGAYTGQLDDRSAAADKVADVDYTAVYQNIQYFPNIALTCVEGLGFATTSTGRGESGGATPLIRVERLDEFCETRRTGTGAPGAPTDPPATKAPVTTVVPVPETAGPVS